MASELRYNISSFLYNCKRLSGSIFTPHLSALNKFVNFLSIYLIEDEEKVSFRGDSTFLLFEWHARSCL